MTVAAYNFAMDPRSFSRIDPANALPAVVAPELQWLPRSPALRIAVYVAAAAAVTLTFAAYLRPNMVFDFANLVFCG